ncbi:MAG: hypothetical protein AB7T49_20920 [Oligoflexales bacterium]
MKIKKHLSAESWTLLVFLRHFAMFMAVSLAPTHAAGATAAVIGDSYATGAFANPELILDRIFLRDYIAGEPPQDAAPQLVRLPPTLREFGQSVYWVFENVLYHFSSQYLDSSSRAWASQLMSDSHLDITSMRIAAYDGAPLSSFNRQVDRVLEQKGEFPDYFFVFFNLGDFCFWTHNDIPSADDYYAQLINGVRYIARNKPAGKEVKVFFMDPIGVLQLFESHKIATKVVSTRGKPLTCGDVYKSVTPEPLSLGGVDPRIELVSEWLTNFPRNFCPRFFDEESRSEVANAILGYRAKTAEMVRYFVQLPVPEVHVRHVTETAKIQFEPEDVANDCLHPSSEGHKKIASAISTLLQK